MSLVKRTGALLAACLVALALVFALGACSSEESSSSSSSESTEAEAAETEATDTESDDTESDDQSSDTEVTSTSTTGAQTYAEWNEEYPYIWPTFAQPLYRSELNGMGHDGSYEYSHYAVWYKDVLYGITWDYTGMNAGYNGSSSMLATGDCLACRSTAFNQYFDEYGYDAFDMTYEDFGYDGGYTDNAPTPYYDCFCCHTDSESLTVEPGTFAKCLIDKWEGYDDLDVNIAVCAQCHNFAGIDLYCMDEDWLTLETIDPYRYGTLPDELHQAKVEDSINEAWPMAGLSGDLGSLESSGVDSEFDQFVNSNHYALGMTCLDCHSEEVTDEETGTTFMSHNFSSSPLQSEEKLEWCMSCHPEIETTEDMAQYYYDTKDTLWAEVDKASDLKLEARSLLHEANAQEGDNKDEELTEIDDLFYKATDYYDWVCGFGETYQDLHQVYGGLSLHDYEDQMTYIADAQDMFQECIDRLNANFDLTGEVENDSANR